MCDEIILDTILDDRDYDRVTFSSKDDIMDFLDSYDIIYNEAKEGNLSALCVIEDFGNLIYDNEIKVCPLVIEYIMIKIGHHKAIQKIEYCKSVIEELATINNRRVKTIDKLLNEEIELIMQRNKDNWKKSIVKKYGTSNFSEHQCKAKEKIKTKEEKEFEQSLWNLDYEIKYGKKKIENNISSEDDNYPQEIKDLEKMYELNKKSLEKLEQVKERSKEEQKELSKRIHMKRELGEDIKAIKDHYGISYYEYNIIENYSDKNALSYDSNMDSLNTTTLGEIDFNLQADEIKISKIKEIADEVLTDKQYVIFELYFFQGLKQKEIANLVGDNQSTISRNINSIITKLKQRLIEV